ncbi:MAG: phosphoheptose isomerase [Euryarchaeota archaeon]|nr:phosphoheptose isomerase [Euryarchaeota archaeon]|tara:strand:- start:1072 stop:1620 length:549 start_codon:yes stop_codon:yes gene_type:complete
MKKNFFKKYFSLQTQLFNFDNQTIKNLDKVRKHIKITKKRGKKVIIFGNGGSAAIANHFSVDLTKISKIRCVNFNESSLLTCFSNDYGYENWVKKTLEFHADAGDLIILISSKGESKNMINACKYLRKKRFFPVITLTGFKKNNSLSKIGHINFWVNSKIYNHVENTHQLLLLSLVDATKKK